MTKRKNKKSLVYRRWWHFESLTFNQVVRGSNPRTLIALKWRKSSIYKGFRSFYVLIL